MSIIAYGPVSSTRPFIPERLAIRSGGRVICVARDADHEVEIGETGLTRLLESHVMALLPASGVLQEGFWLCLEESSLAWFPKAEEGPWRAKRAQELLQAIGPGRGLSQLIGCANMLNVDIKALVASLEQSRDTETESLAAIFLRVKKQMPRHTQGTPPQR